MITLPPRLKRLLSDAAGYGLILLGIAFGWLPGPGGIPLVLAGLGLLSINNAWAARLRDYLLRHGGQLVKVIFPSNRFIQAAHDVLSVVLLGGSLFFGVRHAARWQVSLAIGLFFLALLVAAVNRDRYSHLKHKL